MSCHPWGVEALPPMPHVAALAAEDDVHTTVHNTRTAIRTVEYGVGSAECGRGGMSDFEEYVREQVTKLCPWHLWA